jgi:hypothetical protein
MGLVDKIKGFFGTKDESNEAQGGASGDITSAATDTEAAASNAGETAAAEAEQATNPDAH